MARTPLDVDEPFECWLDLGMSEALFADGEAFEKG
jgi:hypothetical protein